MNELLDYAKSNFKPWTTRALRFNSFWSANITVQEFAEMILTIQAREPRGLLKSKFYGPQVVNELLTWAAGYCGPVATHRMPLAEGGTDDERNR